VCLGTFACNTDNTMWWQIDLCDGDGLNGDDGGGEGERTGSASGVSGDARAEATIARGGCNEWEEELPRSSSPVAYTGKFQVSSEGVCVCKFRVPSVGLLVFLCDRPDTRCLALCFR
jgi:hypothetical protein